MQLDLHDLSLQYEGKRPLFRGLNLTLQEGDFVVIQGPSGSGKSSLLRLLNRLQEPTSGNILVNQEPMELLEVRDLRRRIGYVQQTPVMVAGTVRENLLLPFGFKVFRAREVPSEAELQERLKTYLLDEVSLDEDANQLSVGQKQRIALIRTLLTKPELILADEPTSALDAESREIVQSELERLNQERRLAVILVTHLELRLNRISPRRFRLERSGLVEATS